MEILIPESRVPVLTQTDVLVCGGGCSGIAAAVSAARHGASVVLIERWPSVGGMATNALVNGWHRSDREKMVIYGLVEESAQRAEKPGWIVKDGQYPRAHETHWFDPEGMRIVWQRMLDEAKVKTICYLNAGETVVEGNRIKGVLVDTKTGRKAICAKIVIDATGDGDIAAKCGVPFEYGRVSDGRVQGMTMMWAMRGIEDACRTISDKEVDRILNEMTTMHEGEFPPFNAGNTRHLLKWMKNGSLLNMCPVAGNPLNEEELSALTARSREQIVAYLEYWRKVLPGFEKAELDKTGFSIGIRESRRIKGWNTLTKDMVVGAVKQYDAIGHGVWMIDIHDPKGTGHTTYTDQRKTDLLETGTSYHIPLSMCLNKTIDNLAVAGRCASSTHEAHSSVRVQTHCMVMGQGVGTCAAMALSGSIPMNEINIQELQKNLVDDGVYLKDIPDRIE